MPAKAIKKPPLSERVLNRWKLIEEFRARLEARSAQAPRTFADPRRRLGQDDYLSLMLFGLFNPVVDSMRGLCAASHLGRVQRDICTHPVSLGSFSEAQALVDPELLRKVFEELAAEPGAATCAWRAIATSFWPSMAPSGRPCRAWPGPCGATRTPPRARSSCM